MNEIEIPQRQWPQFCESFTLQHHGWLVSVRQLPTEELERDQAAANGAAQVLSADHLLQDVREGRQDDAVEIMVTVGEGREETSFLIEDAIALFTRRIGDAHEGLRIDSGNGMTTLVRFRSPAAPASLDGLADSER